MKQEIAYDEIVECRVPGELEFVAQAAEKLCQYCLSRGLRTEVMAEVELAVVEGLNNSIEHGCAHDNGETVTLRWHWTDDTIYVEIVDPSDFVPIRGETKLPDDILAEGGRGEFLMNHLMDSVEHQETEAGHALLMSKKVGPSEWGFNQAAEMEATMDALTEDLSRRYEELSALLRVAEELATASSFSEFLDRSMANLVDLVHAEVTCVRFLTDEQDDLRLARSIKHSNETICESVMLDFPCTESLVFLSRNPFTVESCEALPKEDPLHRFGGSAYVCPIFFQAQVLGCLAVTRSADRPYFSAGELSLIRFVGDFLGIVRMTSRLQEQREAEQVALKEIEIAASIQQSLLPMRFPDSDFYRTYGVCQSARQAGGDYLDALNVGDDGILLVIADVMGKGVPAALLATILRTAIRARLDLAQDPGRLLTEVNRQIAHDLASLDMFITAQVAYISEIDHTISISNAGHCPVLHFQEARGDVVHRHGEGVPLGVIDGHEYTFERCGVEPGDLLVFLTDGLYEVENDSGMLGMEKLEAELHRLRVGRPQDYCAPLLNFVRRFSGNQPASDDRTLLTIERLR